MRIKRSRGLIKLATLLASSYLQLERGIFCRAQLSKWALLAVLIPILFLSLLVSADHSLHEKLHKDAAKTSHHCAITLFEQQQLVASDPIIIDIESCFGLGSGIGLADFADFSDHTYRFSASRAPPVLLSRLA